MKKKWESAEETSEVNRKEGRKKEGKEEKRNKIGKEKKTNEK